MSRMWALVANSSYAQVYEITGKGKNIRSIHKIENPDGRLKTGEIVGDRPGRAFDHLGPGRHAMSQEVSTKTHEHQLFAQSLADVLKKGLEEDSFDEIALIAPPEFMGYLHQVIPGPVKQKVTKEVTKNLPNSLPEQKVIDSLCQYLDLWNT